MKGVSIMSVIGFYSTRSKARTAVYNVALAVAVSAQIILMGKVK